MTIRTTAAGILLAITGCQTPPPDAPPPNVVLIISDDQAWTDFGFMGHEVIRTPNLDQLAAQSAVFTRGYVPSSLCRPSLATMITGLYPHQHRITGNDPPRGVKRDRMLKHIAQVPTLPKLLGERGYRSLQTGKWWEGNCRCGDFTDGMTHGDPARGGRHGDEGLKIGRETMQPIYDFVDDCGTQPFFLWYAPFLPHTPHNPPERLLEHYKDLGISERVARYYAMCEWFDETCGQLLGHLETRGLRENTIVLFAVDNGWIQRPNRRGFAARSKRSPYEGGVRTPIMVSWPEHVAPGHHEALASTIDLAPTILRACGAPGSDSLPGRDLIAEASNDTESKRAIFGEIFSHDVADIDRPSQSLRYRWSIDGRWKLISPTDAQATPELYDIVTDPHEEHDLASSQADRIKKMRRQLDGWWRPDRRQ
jgi:arylsulfatase A-like enzyme